MNKLDEALVKIAAVFEEYDVAGQAIVCSGEESKYLNYSAKPDGPSWSVLYANEEGVRLKTTNIANDALERSRLEQTVQAVFTMRDLLAIQLQMYLKLGDLIEANMEVEHLRPSGPVV